jgi:hypothetical protein
VGRALLPIVNGSQRDEVCGGQGKIHDVLFGKAAKRRRLVELCAAAAEDGDEVEQPEGRDATRACLLLQCGVVAP